MASKRAKRRAREQAIARAQEERRRRSCVGKQGDADIDATIPVEDAAGLPAKMRLDTTMMCV